MEIIRETRILELEIKRDKSETDSVHEYLKEKYGEGSYKIPYSSPSLIIAHVYLDDNDDKN